MEALSDLTENVRLGQSWYLISYILLLKLIKMLRVQLYGFPVFPCKTPPLLNKIYMQRVATKWDLKPVFE